MSVWIRIALYLVAGWFYGKGYIGDEVKALVTTDPAIVASIEVAVSGFLVAVPLYWRKLAKRYGWST